MRIVNFKEPYIMIKKSGGGTINLFDIPLEIENHIEILIEECNKIMNYFSKFKEFKYLPITLNYDALIPKTKRIKNIFKFNNLDPKQIFSKYNTVDGEINSISLTYKCSYNNVKETLDFFELINSIKKGFFSDLKKCLDDLTNLESRKSYFSKNNSLSKEEKNAKVNEFSVLIKNRQKDFFALSKEKYFLTQNDIKTMITLKDLKKIEVIFSEKVNKEMAPIFCFYDIIDHQKFIKILKKENIFLEDSIDDLFYSIDIDSYNKIVEKYPFIISHCTENKEINIKKINGLIDSNIKIDIENKNNIIGEKIGVIDTQCSFPNEMSNLYENIDERQSTALGRNDEHGTFVNSLIIMNDKINPWMNDNFGTMRTKNFEFLADKPTNVFWLMKKILKVVDENEDIKIWNLSLGSETDDKDISGRSEFGKLLDYLSIKKDILFIVASGNYNFISSPGDSIHALTVGSIFKDINGNDVISNYCGKEKIYKIFEKPDVYDYGNSFTEDSSYSEYVKVMNLNGDIIDTYYSTNSNGQYIEGTSYATPIVSRKANYIRDFLIKKNMPSSSNSVKSILNLIASTSDKGIKYIDINNFFKNKNDILLLIDGKINPKENKRIEIDLPSYDNFIKDGERTGFNISYSLCFKPKKLYSLGDESSNISITFNIKREYEDKNGILKKENIIKVKNDKSIFKNEKTLRQLYGKYNNNAIVVNEGFADNNFAKISPGKNNKFFIEVNRVDLFDDNDDEIDYSISVYIKETKKDSLSNFVELNNDNIINNIDIEQDDIEIIADDIDV